MKGKKCVYTLNEADVFSRNLMEGEKNLECLPYTDDTRDLKAYPCVSYMHPEQEGDSWRSSLVFSLQVIIGEKQEVSMSLGNCE